MKQEVEIAARVISSGQPTTRRFDSCFEWYGASAVAVALYRRAQKRPNTRLAQNLYKYISKELTERDAELYKEWTDLEALAGHLKCSK
jgi:hypothetical protein